MNSTYRKPRVRVVGVTSVLLKGGWGLFSDWTNLTFA